LQITPRIKVSDEGTDIQEEASTEGPPLATRKALMKGSQQRLPKTSTKRVWKKGRKRNWNRGRKGGKNGSRAQKREREG